MALHQRNARMMYRKNNTAIYIGLILTKEDLKFLHQKARQVDAFQLEKKRRQEQALGDEEVVDRKRKKIAIRASKRQAVNNALDMVEFRLDIASIRGAPGTNSLLDSELGWFRRIEPEVPTKAKLGSKTLKIEALCAAVSRHNIRLAQSRGAEAELDSSSSGSDFEVDSDIDSDADLELGY